MRVIFRKSDGELVAVLPEVEANPYNLTCYAHVGQHSECSPHWYFTTSAATTEEYTPLLSELTQIYAPEPINVRKRLASGDWQRWATPQRSR